MTLKVGHFPNHGPDANVSTVEGMENQKVDCADSSESYHIYTRLFNSHVYHAFGTNKWKADARNRVPGHDSVALVNLKHEVIDHGFVFGCSSGIPLKWNPARVINWAVFESSEGTILVIAAHPNPGKGLQIKYRIVMFKVEKLIKWGRKKGFIPIVIGDLQVRDKPFYSKKWHPRILFKRNHMEWISEGIDWVAWGKELEQVEPHEVGHINAARITKGEDHPWLIVRLMKRVIGKNPGPGKARTH